MILSRYPDIELMLDQIVMLCESGDYGEAMKAISSCIAAGSANSEIYRLRGQIEFDREDMIKLSIA